MLRKVIKYTDFDGNPREDVCYFNLTKSEIMEMELGYSGGMSALFTHLLETKDAASVAQILKKIVLASYGEKSPDGRRFVKSKDLSDGFYQSKAYDELFFELLEPEALEDFLMAVMPTEGKTKEEIKAAANAVLKELPGV